MCNGVKSDFFRISLLISVWLVSDGSGQMNPAPPPQNGGGTPPGSGTAGGGTPNAGTTNTIGSSFFNCPWSSKPINNGYFRGIPGMIGGTGQTMQNSQIGAKTYNHHSIASWWAVATKHFAIQGKSALHLSMSPPAPVNSKSLRISLRMPYHKHPLWGTIVMTPPVSGPAPTGNNRPSPIPVR